MDVRSTDNGVTGSGATSEIARWEDEGGASARSAPAMAGQSSRRPAPPRDSSATAHERPPEESARLALQIEGGEQD